MKLIILTKEFYNKYDKCSEILKKHDRPYACVAIKTETCTFAIPFRHHINHKYSFHTIGEAGLDFTKAVVIVDDRYVSGDHPTIESAEFAIIRRDEQKIIYEFSRFLRQYRRAMAHPEHPRNHNLLKYSALQYFEEYL